MRLLIVGNGGREHALTWKLIQSPKVTQIYVAPGNAGTANMANVENIDISPIEIDKLLSFAQNKTINLVVVGPEAPLISGISDRFQQAGIPCVGPVKEAAQLEGSKSFAKSFMQMNGIPTAKAETFSDLNQAIAYLEKHSMPVVIKADGLASGKGVIIAQDIANAKQAVQQMLVDSQFGIAGHTVVIEEYLQGEELSFIALTDGTHVFPLASSKDHKTRDAGNHGPNTGGMGAISPAPNMTDNLHKIVMEQIIAPTVSGMQNAGINYKGFLYAGIMLTAQGPKVLEFNCRLGDPETQPILMRLQSDLLTLLLATVNGTLDQVTAEWCPDTAISVVLASKGYPGEYETGFVIEGLNRIPDNDKATLFHAGTKLVEQKIFTNGGRVCAATALGETVKQARKNAYSIADTIQWPGRFFRQDIGEIAEIAETIT